MVGMMDAKVDAALSDEVWYAVAGSDQYVPMDGFFLTEEPGGYEAEPDDVAVRLQMKISQAQVPQIRRGDRIKRSKDSDLVYQPVTGSETMMGRYWLFNIQKAT